MRYSQKLECSFLFQSAHAKPEGLNVYERSGQLGLAIIFVGLFTSRQKDLVRASERSSVTITTTIMVLDGLFMLGDDIPTHTHIYSI